MQKLRQAAEMVLEVFDNDYGQMAKDIAMAEMRQALHDREETNVNTLDTLKLALQCIDYHWDNPDHELEETPFVLETRRALRQAIDKETTLAPKDVAAIIEDMPQGMDADAFLVELANRATTTERERCAKIALSGTGLPVQVATLKILKKERERIAAAIFEMDKDQ